MNTSATDIFHWAVHRRQTWRAPTCSGREATKLLAGWWLRHHDWLQRSIGWRKKTAAVSRNRLSQTPRAASDSTPCLKRRRHQQSMQLNDARNKLWNQIKRTKSLKINPPPAANQTACDLSFLQSKLSWNWMRSETFANVTMNTTQHISSRRIKQWLTTICTSNDY